MVRCRRFAVWGLAVAGLVAACGDDDTAPQPRPLPRAEPGEAAPALEPRPVPGPQVARFYEGYLAEVLRGDVEMARGAYREVMRRADTRQPVLAARAALRLAAIEAWTGNRREAVELVARASALGGHDRGIAERGERLQNGIAALEGGRNEDVRGPPIGTELVGVSDEARVAFARAEQLALEARRVDVSPRIEDPWAGARARQRAAEAAIRAYGKVIDLEQDAATVAAEFRIGSLYHDLAVALVSEEPAELDRSAVGRLRSQQRAKAARHLRTARLAYLRALAIGESPASARWRREARKALESVEVLLRAD